MCLRRQSLLMFAVGWSGIRRAASAHLLSQSASLCCFSDSARTTRRKRSRNSGKGRQDRDAARPGPHPRNKFKGSYDMEKLCDAYPPLSHHIIRPDDTSSSNAKNEKPYNLRPTIKFADPDAVRALNTALLVADYNIQPSYSDVLPQDALVPPIPGRADYIHIVADVLAEASDSWNVPNGPSIRGLDVGTGASVIYPLIANSAYGWNMVGSDVNPPSIKSACEIVKANNLQEVVDVRLQPSADKAFDNIWGLNEDFDFVICNPPFFPSLEKFQSENARKVKGLARGGANKRSRGAIVDSIDSEVETRQKLASNNFGGLECELWCKGGEVTFVKRMVDESRIFRDRCLWFTSLVSRRENLANIEQYLKKEKKKSNELVEIRKVSMGAGTKSASIIMWTYTDEFDRQEWASTRWD